jgi:hypothetical protein
MSSALLGSQAELGGLGLDCEVRDVFVVVAVVTDLEDPLGGIEPLEHLAVVLKDDGEPPFRVGIELGSCGETGGLPASPAGERAHLL